MIVVKQLISDTGIVYGTIEYSVPDNLKKSGATIKDAPAPRSVKRQS